MASTKDKLYKSVVEDLTMTLIMQKRNEEL
jgi:hypothetical protein